MDTLPIIMIVAGVMLIVLRIWLGPNTPSATAAVPPSPELADPELWSAEALAEHGTSDTVAELAAQGRADELRGLGYEGDIPDR